MFIVYLYYYKHTQVHFNTLYKNIIINEKRQMLWQSYLIHLLKSITVLLKSTEFYINE